MEAWMKREYVPARLTSIGVSDDRVVVAEFNGGEIALGFGEAETTQVLLRLAEAAGEMHRAVEASGGTPLAWQVAAVRRQVQPGGREVLLEATTLEGLVIRLLVPLALWKSPPDAGTLPRQTSSAKPTH